MSASDVACHCSSNRTMGHDPWLHSRRDSSSANVALWAMSHNIFRGLFVCNRIWVDMKTLVLQSGLVVLFYNSLLNHISSRNQLRIGTFGSNSYILIIGSGTRLVKAARNQLGLWLWSRGARYNRSSNSGSLSALNEIDFRSDSGWFLTPSFFGLRDRISIGHLGIH